VKLATRGDQPIPEFLKGKGRSHKRFHAPPPGGARDRIIIGSDSCDPGQLLWMRELYAPFIRQAMNAFCLWSRDAELSKYAANAFLASRISFIELNWPG